jgi:IS30 family transposase
MTVTKNRNETGWRQAAERVGLRRSDLEREMGRNLTERERDELEDAQMADLALSRHDQPSIRLDDYLEKHGLDRSTAKRR